MFRLAVPAGRVRSSSIAVVTSLAFILIALVIPSRTAAQDVVTRVAGSGGSRGSADGFGTAARFGGPLDAVMNAAGTVAYVVDSFNSTIRRIDLSTNEVTTFAGSPGQSGSTDGIGTAARFSYPAGIAMSPDGTTLYVTGNQTVRRIDIATAAVTTIAGAAGQTGYVDATGSAARFYIPNGLAVKADGTTLYVADSMNCRIRAINLSTNAVTTLAGAAGAVQQPDGPRRGRERPDVRRRFDQQPHPPDRPRQR
jgi:DNA-binding beta-propeller fold protein YncE